MIITKFDKSIVFRVSPQFALDVEIVLRKWINKNELRNQFYLEKMYHDIFPLQFPALYLINLSWANPCQYFTKPSNIDNYVWITLDKEDNILDFDSLLRLQFKSYSNSEYVENQALVISQLLDRKEDITIKTV